jgi:hypothetical protein
VNDKNQPSVGENSATLRIRWRDIGATCDTLREWGWVVVALNVLKRGVELEAVRRGALAPPGWFESAEYRAVKPIQQGELI